MNHRWIEQFLPAEAIALGAECIAEGRVLSAERSRNEGLFFGRVRGSGRRINQVVATIKTDAQGRATFSSYCSCSVRTNCKHVAAILLTLAEDAAEQPGGLDSGASTPLAPALPDGVRAWLERVTESTSRAEKAALDPYRVLYILELRRFGNGLSRAELSTVKARQLVDGSFGASYRFDLLGRTEARFVQPIDRRIMGLAHAHPRSHVNMAVPLDDSVGPEMLRLALETGRAFWMEPNGLILKPGAVLESRLDWRLGDDGALRVVAVDADPSPILLPLTPPWYLNPITGECGPLQCGLPDREAALLTLAPPVPPGAAADLQEAMRSRAPQVELPLPPVPKRRQVQGTAPTPVLRLITEQVEYGYSGEVGEYDFALLSFDYDGALVSPEQLDQSVQRMVGETLLDIERDLPAERAAVERLEALGMEPDPTLRGDDGLVLVQEDDADWITFVEYQVPALRHDGWRVEIDDGFAFQVVHTGDWEIDVDASEGGRWLDIALGVDIDGERQDLLPLLLGLLRDPNMDLSPARLAAAPDDAMQPIRLPDGRIVLLPVSRLRPLLSTLVELYDPRQTPEQPDRFRLGRLQAAQLAELADADPNLKWHGDEAVRDWGRQLRDFQRIERVEPPPGLGGDEGAELRPYQRDGLDWLQFLSGFGVGGILADDMGLGKTIQTLAHLLMEKQSGRADRPSLVVAPTSLMFNWRREAARFAPALRVLLLHGPARSRSFTAIPDSDLVLTTYALLPRDLETLAAQPWHLVILDEATAVKNPRSKAAQAVRSLDARHRLCLTGTPLENHLGELWSLFDFLLPDLLSDERRFRRLFRNPIERQGDPLRAEQLRRRIAPFLLRRTKEQVAAELPPKTEILREVPLLREQRDLYETLRLALNEQVQAEISRKGLARSGIIILDALLKLRQCCCDPRLVSLPSAARVKGSAKLDLLFELLPELLEEGRRILLFSQFTSMLKLIEEALAERLDWREGRNYVKLTGRTRNRETPVDRFQSGAVPLFLISLKAGGSGLNLTAADTVIHYDPWWNPAAERQATDRAHRLGQDKPVFVYKLLTEGTVEQRVAALQARKQALADTMLEGGDSAARSLTQDDLAMLFAPID
jgi:hypothetical protein